jgi:PPOX class probable F420-dependent enzyme
MSSEEVSAFLSEPRTGVLTTLGSDGFPHSTGMWFVPDRELLLMWTYARSQKARNLMRDPRCSFLVEDGTAYDELRGILVRARTRLIEDRTEIEDIGRRLYERYTLPRIGIPVEKGPITEIHRQAMKRIGIQIPFERVASWDHTKL